MHAAGVQMVGKFVGAGKILGQYRRHEPVSGLITEIDRLTVALEGRDGRDRPEDLFIKGGHTRPYIGNHYRRVENAVALSSGEESRTLLAGFAHDTVDIGGLPMERSTG
jgi:hypothetical protein